ncbi:MAG: glycosyltransferase family 8 protein [Oscillospiraceae bacterium]|nr:glycosyltransferase family 8 protein [Oscillospiraceae bacterium]
MKTQNEIPVFFSIDNSYAPFLAAALYSAQKNCNKNRKYRAVVLYQDLSEENIKRLSALASENFSIDFVEMKSGLDSITDRMSNRLRCDYFTLTIYFRLFIPAMVPEYDKGIYIDSDVIVCGDLAELFDTDLKDNLMGACTDLSVADVPELVNYMENAVGVKKEEYINSGVLLMNLKKMREQNLESHFLNLLNTYHFDCIAPDQDYLNAICNGKILYLGQEWDTMPNQSAEPLKDPKLIHYNLFSKPWCYDGVQYSKEFWQYAQNCGYIDEIKAYKEAYSDEQKKKDSECLGLLVQRGNDMPKNEITFKKLFESGVKIRL